MRTKWIPLKQDAQLLLICFPEVIKRIVVPNALISINDKILSLLIYLSVQFYLQANLNDLLVHDKQKNYFSFKGTFYF